LTLGSTTVVYVEASELLPIEETPEAFLQCLKYPTWIHIKGRDSSRCRVLTTLLHGNEPSGLIALHRWLQEGIVPQTDIHCLVASVPAALQEPLLSTRMLPGCRDLNRCFRPPFNDAQGQLAEEILAYIEKLAPEAVIDIHNTSGDGPAFGVSTISNSVHTELTALFCHRLVITNIMLGALMEIATDDFHVVTVEVGGREEPGAHEIAYQGLCHYMTAANLFDATIKSEVFETLQHPVRLEIKKNKTLAYGLERAMDMDVTIIEEIEKYNFGETPADRKLGWLGEAGIEALTLKGPDGEELLGEYFQAVDDTLRTAIPMKLFMATPDPVLAIGDCLFYLVPMERCR